MIPSHDAAERGTGYAMPADFCKIFSDHLDHLYTLALLLTADHLKAEQCFVAGLEDCLQGNSVFRNWAQAWATRTIIKNAIRMISPSQNETNTMTVSYKLEEPVLAVDTSAVAITKLPPFDRFVYVMSVLEKYPDRECSILLDCRPEDIVGARIRGFQRLVRVVNLTQQEAVHVAASP